MYTFFHFHSRFKKFDQNRTHGKFHHPHSILSRRKRKPQHHSLITDLSQTYFFPNRSSILQRKTEHHFHFPFQSPLKNLGTLEKFCPTVRRVRNQFHRIQTNDSLISRLSVYVHVQWCTANVSMQPSLAIVLAAAKLVARNTVSQRGDKKTGNKENAENFRARRTI